METRQRLIDTVLRKCEAMKRAEEARRAMRTTYAEYTTHRDAYEAATREIAQIEQQQKQIEQQHANGNEDDQRQE